MAKGRSRRNGNGRRVAVRTSPMSPGLSPSRTLTRTLRYQEVVRLDNQAGVGIDAYAYNSSYQNYDVTKSKAWVSAASTFEFWRLKKCRTYIQLANVGTGNLINTHLSALDATVVWTAPDYSSSDIAGGSIIDYHNARAHSISLNGLKKIVDTEVRLNISDGNRALLPKTTWLDTANVSQADTSYSGYQLFIQNFSTSFFTLDAQPAYLLITEMDVEFMQPAFQNVTGVAQPLPVSSQESAALERLHRPVASDPKI